MVESNEAPQPEIVVEKKFGEFRVHIKGQEGAWAQGVTVLQAVGTLVLDHPQLFNIKINYDAVDSLQPTKN
jgi:hypothetical protein